LLGFLGLPYRDSFFSAFARPHNVNRPVDTMLTPEQAAQFAMLATPMMKRLGYAGQPEYAENDSSRCTSWTRSRRPTPRVRCKETGGKPPIIGE